MPSIAATYFSQYPCRQGSIHQCWYDRRVLARLGWVFPDWMSVPCRYSQRTHQTYSTNDRLIAFLLLSVLQCMRILVLVKHWTTTKIWVIVTHGSNVHWCRSGFFLKRYPASDISLLLCLFFFDLIVLHCVATSLSLVEASLLCVDQTAYQHKKAIVQIHCLFSEAVSMMYDVWSINKQTIYFNL